MIERVRTYRLWPSQTGAGFCASLANRRDKFGIFIFHVLIYRRLVWNSQVGILRRMLNEEGNTVTVGLRAGQFANPNRIQSSTLLVDCMSSDEIGVLRRQIKVSCALSSPTFLGLLYSGRLPFRRFSLKCSNCRLSSLVRPPRENGRMWSI